MNAHPGFSGTLSELGAADGASEDEALARRHLPLLMLDTREPYLPLVAGYTVFRAPGVSKSSSFPIEPRGAATIEYALWYDWDIQHLYDLEHVWVHVGEEGDVVAVEASAHGQRLAMNANGDHLPRLEAMRPVLFVEPGKHAHWPEETAMRDAAAVKIGAMCGPLAGFEGVHEGNRFAETGRYAATAFDHRLARLKMLRDAFEPAFTFSRTGDEGEGVRLVPWPVLETWIPSRVKRLIAALPEAVPHLKGVFLDCGDTLVDEGTEEKRPGTEVVLAADLIDGAAELLTALKAKGYPLALVADGPRETFENVLQAHGLWDAFDAHVISGDVGELKPSGKMFSAAMAALGLEEADAPFVAMVGNNLSRDVLGANAFGLISVFFAWSDRRSRVPGRDGERPDYTIGRLDDLLMLLDGIERLMPFAQPPSGEVAS